MFSARSVYWRHRMERREVLPTVHAVADARENLPSGDVRRGASRHTRDLNSNRIVLDHECVITGSIWIVYVSTGYIIAWSKWIIVSTGHIITWSNWKMYVQTGFIKTESKRKMYVSSAIIFKAGSIRMYVWTCYIVTGSNGTMYGRLVSIITGSNQTIYARNGYIQL